MTARDEELLAYALREGGTLEGLQDALNRLASHRGARDALDRAYNAPRGLPGASQCLACQGPVDRDIVHACTSEV